MGAPDIGAIPKPCENPASAQNSQITQQRGSLGVQRLEFKITTSLKQGTGHFQEAERDLLVEI